MAWTSEVSLDADKTNVGWVTAIWNAGQATEFRYGARVRATMPELNAFVAAAKAALTAHQAKTAQEAIYVTTVTNALNA